MSVISKQFQPLGVAKAELPKRYKGFRVTRAEVSKIVVASALTVFGGLATVPATASGIPTFDVAQALNFLEQMKEMQKQLETAKSTLMEAKRMYDTVSGIRGFGDILRNPELAKYLPAEWKQVYDMASSVGGGGYAGITGSVEEILRSLAVDGNSNEALAKFNERESKTAATNKALGMRAFEGAKQRLEQIEGLMNQISRTQDPKAIAELQARISGEQATIQNEMTKLQMMTQLQTAERELLAQQKKQIMMKDLSASNTAMPEIK